MQKINKMKKKSQGIQKLECGLLTREWGKTEARTVTVEGDEDSILRVYQTFVKYSIKKPTTIFDLLQSVHPTCEGCYAYSVSWKVIKYRCGLCLWNNLKGPRKSDINKNSAKPEYQHL